jgi:hypothetical protein
VTLAVDRGDVGVVGDERLHRRRVLAEALVIHAGERGGEGRLGAGVQAAGGRERGRLGEHGEGGEGRVLGGGGGGPGEGASRSSRAGSSYGQVVDGAGRRSGVSKMRAEVQPPILARVMARDVAASLRARRAHAGARRWVVTRGAAAGRMVRRKAPTVIAVSGATRRMSAMRSPSRRVPLADPWSSIVQPSTPRASRQ